MITKKRDTFTNLSESVEVESSHKDKGWQWPHETASEISLFVNELHLFKKVKELGTPLAK